ncbi:hypothetical protein AB0K60_09325 [Thermopolyspora sp. NPDC052614]|uniref:hypothetical protein n=1 Tax=Thermopolyspora sp. NPDC052614 TaxID=3155682 RepID=UPI003443D440
MKVLCIGGTGAISSACVAGSVARGHDVHVLTRGRTVRRRPPPPGVRPIVADARDPEAVRAAHGGADFDRVVDFLGCTERDAAATVDRNKIAAEDALRRAYDERGFPVNPQAVGADRPRSGLILGDPAHSAVFDNSKVKRFVPSYRPVIIWSDGVRRPQAWRTAHAGHARPDPTADALLNRLVEAHHRAREALTRSGSVAR